MCNTETQIGGLPLFLFCKLLNYFLDLFTLSNLTGRMMWQKPKQQQQKQPVELYKFLIESSVEIQSSKIFIITHGANST